MNGILKKTALAVTGFMFLASSATAAPMLPNFVPLAKNAGPAVVNISVGAPLTTIGAEGTIACPFDSKKSRKA